MGGRESERLIVPAKRGNKPQRDPVEGRGRRNTNPKEGKMPGALTPDLISTRIQRIAKLAREMPDTAFFSLAHHIDLEFLREAYRRTRKGGAVGVDGQTADEYAKSPRSSLRVRPSR